jgi:antitoxin ParD1/3/4
MPNTYALGKHFETFVQSQIASGRYGNASEVLREALRIMESRERRLASLDAAIEQGIADITDGRVHGAGSSVHELKARYAKLFDT